MTSEAVSTLAATRDILGWCVLHGATVRVPAFRPTLGAQVAVHPAGVLPPHLRRLLKLPDVRTRVAQYMSAGAARFCAGAPDARNAMVRARTTGSADSGGTGERTPGKRSARD